MRRMNQTRDQIYLEVDSVLELVHGEDVSGPDFQLVLGQDLLLLRVVEVFVGARLHGNEVERVEDLEKTKITEVVKNSFSSVTIQSKNWPISYLN